MNNKKKSIFLLSAFIMSLMSVSNANAAEIDISNLNKVILAKNQATESDDINSDNIIDIFDSIELRKIYMKNQSSTGEIKTDNYSATEENVKLVGRNYINKGTTWLTQSGSAVEFDVTGTSVEITLAGDGSVNSEDAYKPRYAVILDGEVIKDSLMSKSSETIKVFESKSSKKATVKVILLSEGAMGAVGVSNISVTSEYTNPIKPVPKKELSIEFIGDSITCAYGVEGKSSSESFKTSTENFMKSYAYLTAKQLNADYSAVSYSGHGIISGYTSSNKRVTESLIPDYYGLINKNSDYAYEWDFKSHPNDVVVINLGTNDSSYLSYDFDASAPDFINGYVDFLYDVREKNPDAYIICTLGTMGGYDVYELITQAVDRFNSETGDKKVSYYRSTTQNASDGYGSDWHPSEITQQNSAYVLADKICQVLGIESSQIGLNMAENSEYNVVINNSNAYAAQYVGYDKSFWINTSNGGEDKSDIEACISDIALKKGAEYCLEFDYTSSVSDVEIPFDIRLSSDANKSAYSDKFKTSSDKLHYSAEFTSEFTDAESALVFYLGGNDYFNLTLSNIKLTKLS